MNAGFQTQILMLVLQVFYQLSHLAIPRAIMSWHSCKIICINENTIMKQTILYN